MPTRVYCNQSNYTPWQRRLDRRRELALGLCGIAGFTHRGGRPEPGRIQKIVAGISHRGPDQAGIYESAWVSLGAARLKILDLQGGDQPLTTADRDTTIVFNGEIYNHQELRAELSRLGHEFRTRCDTEVVLRSFLEWDTGCFSRLRGMFAFGLWVESEKRLVLARDRMGIKPLYLHRRGSNLYFGSELKTILEHPEIERRLDPTALEYYLALNYVPCPSTLIEGVEKLRPGHWLEWRDGVIETAAYWRLEMREQRQWKLEPAKEELDRLLNSAVREHLAADVGLGIWLSGGLDSSCILHYAASNSSSRLKTFSISFEGRTFDESRYFREVAARYGTEHHELDLNPTLDLAAAIEQLPFHQDEPIADAGALPVWFLSRFSRPHVSVALSGEGADELFGGYIAYVADALARRFALAPDAIRRLFLGTARFLPSSSDKISFEYKLKRFLEGSFLDPDTAHSFWNGGFSPESRRLVLPSADMDGIRKLYGGLTDDRRLSVLNRRLWFDQMFYLPDDILSKCDRMSMAHSLEVRPPFLDHRIVEFAASLPANMKIRGFRQKFLLRKLLEHRLPSAVIKRKKEGFDIPSHEWLRGVLRPLLLDTLTPEAIAGTGLFQAERVQEMIRTHIDRRANLGVQLWGLLILFLWIRRWRIQCGHSASAEERNALAAFS